nr:MAG TPA_asm: hypothetical protein [Caudoviricetes sp.]
MTAISCTITFKRVSSWSICSSLELRKNAFIMLPC